MEDAIADLAAKNRLPTMCPTVEWMDAGFVISYGTSLSAVYRRAPYLACGAKFKASLIVNGKVREVRVRPSVSDRNEAIKWLSDRGWGRDPRD